MTSASTKQMDFIAKLAGERDLSAMPVPEAMTIQQASAYISWALQAPKLATVPSVSNGQDIEVGVYVDAMGSIIKVQQNKAKTRQYAMVWTDINGQRLTLEGDRVQGEWHYEAGLIITLKPQYRMTIDQALSFTLRFAQCAKCGRHLKDAESVEKGVGPVCRKSFALAAA